MKPIRIVVAGLGSRGFWGVNEVLRHPEFELSGLVDSDPDRLGMFKQELKLAPNLPCFEDLKQCLERVDTDALAVFTPDGQHADLIMAALEAGKWVFAEKPLEVTEQKLQAIVEAGRRAGGRTFVGFNLRYAPTYVKVRELLDSGVAGQVLTIQADEFYDGGRTYFRRWNRLRAMGGGLWVTKGCHDFDLLYWLAGTLPQSIYAVSSLDHYLPRPEAALYCRDCLLRHDCPDRYDRYVPRESLMAKLNQASERRTGRWSDLCLYNSEKDGCFDHGIATVTFQNHVIACYTLNVVAGFTNRTLRVGGTKATIDADLIGGRIVIRRRDPSGQDHIDLPIDPQSHGGADEHVFGQFSRFVRGLPTRFVAPAEAAVAVRMGLAATRSSDEGRVVRMDL